MTTNNNSMGLGFMAAFAVSGSVVLIARHVHKHLVSDFMKKIEFELVGMFLFLFFSTFKSDPWLMNFVCFMFDIGSKRCQAKKRVRFAEDVIEPSSNNKQYRDRHLARIAEGSQMMNRNYGPKFMEAMPVNRQILYKGILEYKTLKGCVASAWFWSPELYQWLVSTCKNVVS